MQCPRKYQYSIVEGWRKKDLDPHLTAGSLLQEGVEKFQLARLRGESVEEAGVQAVEYLLQASGEFVGEELEWRAWGGVWAQRWRCLGEAKYVSPRTGKKAKCPYSHRTSAGPKWFDEEPEIGNFPFCSCGSRKDFAWHYVPDHPTKNRLTLLRAMVDFIDAQDEVKGLQIWSLPSGTPGVELQTCVPLGLKSAEGEDYILVTNMDEVNTWQGHLWPTDNKSTGGKLGDYFFEGFSPDVQFDTYDLVASLQPFPLPVGGVAIRGIRMGGPATERAVDVEYVTKTEGQREEHWRGLQWWVKQAEALAESGQDYPQSKVSCGRCSFRGVCDSDPSMRRATLERHFERRPWNPVLRERGKETA